MSLEERIRESLSRVASSAEVSQARWAELRKRAEGRGRSRKTSRLAVAIVALALSFGALGLLWLAFLQPESESPPVLGDSPQTPNPIVAKTIAGPPQARAIATADGRVWIVVSELSLSEACTGGLLWIDPASGVVSEPIPTEGIPTAVTVGGGAVWVAQRTCSGTGDRFGEEVLRYDSSSLQLVARVPVPEVEGPAGDLAYGAGRVWATWGDPQGSGQVVVVDALTNELTARVPVQGRLRDIAVSNGLVWALDTGPAQGTLIRIDAGTAAVLSRISLGESPAGLAVQPEAAWTATAEGLLRVDAATDAVTVISAAGSGGTPIVADEPGVWFFAPDGDSGNQLLSHLDATTQVVDAAVPLAGFPVDAALDAASNSIWLLAYEDSVIQVSY